MKLGLISLLLLGCTGLGFLKTIAIYEKLRLVRSYQEFLHRIRSEILFVQTPLLESVIQASVNCSDVISPFVDLLKEHLQNRSWNRFSDLWEHCCEQIHFDPEFADIWKRLGRQLGRGGLEQQAQALKYCEQELERLESQTLDQVKVRGKMYISVGMCCGVFLTILVI